MLGNLLDHLEPVISDDEGDYAAAEVNFHMIQVDGDPSPAQCRSLVVCCSGAAATLARSSFAMAPLPWLLAAADGSRWEEARCYPPLPSATRFYTAGAKQTAEGAVAVAVLPETLPVQFAAAWTATLLDAFKGVEEILVLGHMLRAEWRTAAFGGDRPEEPYLCGLSTSDSLAAGIPQLPSPNHIEGAAAAILSECAASQRQCQCAVVLTLQDGAHLGEASLSAFEKLRPSLTRLGLLGEGQGIDYRKLVSTTRTPVSMSIYA
mmetsp:Transcript_46380/g.110466  ORF Transcript_46380/g.110466 Transcript_46380/m.110466 type:complete len:263 (-) Transcript_46380:70-858(-)